MAKVSIASFVVLRPLEAAQDGKRRRVKHRYREEDIDKEINDTIESNAIH